MTSRNLTSALKVIFNCYVIWIWFFRIIIVIFRSVIIVIIIIVVVIDWTGYWTGEMTSRNLTSALKVIFNCYVIWIWFFRIIIFRIIIFSRIVTLKVIFNCYVIWIWFFRI